jgi:uncharacterized RmlC-like cupin family protein
MAGECVVVRASAAAEGVTGLTYAAGISATTVGARGLCLQLASLPPGARSKVHQHDEHESGAYMLEGELVMWSGAELEHKVVVRPGDFVYIPNGVPHLVLNPSDSEPAVAVLSRTDANEQEDVTELPHLEALPHLQPETAA